MTLPQMLMELQRRLGFDDRELVRLVRYLCAVRE